MIVATIPTRQIPAVAEPVDLVPNRNSDATMADAFRAVVSAMEQFSVRMDWMSHNVLFGNVPVLTDSVTTEPVFRNTSGATGNGIVQMHRMRRTVLL